LHVENYIVTNFSYQSNHSPSTTISHRVGNCDYETQPFYYYFTSCWELWLWAREIVVKVDAWEPYIHPFLWIIATTKERIFKSLLMSFNEVPIVSIFIGRKTMWWSTIWAQNFSLNLTQCVSDIWKHCVCTVHVPMQLDEKF
jgi:hypothetical protein